MKRYLLMLFVLFVFGCKPKQTPQTNTEQTVKHHVNSTPTTGTVSASASNDEYTTTKTGKKIPVAEEGITIRFDDGWKKEDMDFHLDYCKQMMAGVKSEINADVFCPCFLDKIQYYYEPIYFKEAYQDQKKWNEACYQAAMY